MKNLNISLIHEILISVESFSSQSQLGLPNLEGDLSYFNQATGEHLFCPFLLSVYFSCLTLVYVSAYLVDRKN